ALAAFPGAIAFRRLRRCSRRRGISDGRRLRRRFLYWLVKYSGPGTNYRTSRNFGSRLRRLLPFVQASTTTANVSSWRSISRIPGTAGSSTPSDLGLVLEINWLLARHFKIESCAHIVLRFLGWRLCFAYRRHRLAN